jgi:hypothetical protein
MRHLTLITLLTTAGLLACSSSPLGPSQATTGATMAAPAGSIVAPTGLASAPGGTTAAPTATPPAPGSDCVQDGENIDTACGDQTTPDGTGTPETPGVENPELP